MPVLLVKGADNTKRNLGYMLKQNIRGPIPQAGFKGAKAGVAGDRTQDLFEE